MEKKNNGKKNVCFGFRSIHSPEIQRRFEHVPSKVGLYIANLPAPRVLSNSNRSWRQGVVEKMPKIEESPVETSGSSTDAAAPDAAAPADVAVAPVATAEPKIEPLKIKVQVGLL